jgi:hypothetical protein
MKLLPILLLLVLPAVVQAQFTFTTNYDGSLNIATYTGSGRTVVIPATTNGLPVTSIGDYAFYGCSRLTNVMIGNNVTSIGDWTFYGCNLSSIIIGNSVTSIGETAFSWSPISNLTIPNSVTSIEFLAFGNCYNLTNVTIGSGVTYLADDVFWECTSLISLYFKGDAPGGDTTPFYETFFGVNAIVYYLPGTIGWDTTFGYEPSLPTVLWNPQVQTDDSCFGVRTNQFGFNITGTSNLVVVVEACTNFAIPVWTPVSTNTLNTFIGTNGTSYFSDPKWTNYPGRFYRLQMP